MHNYMRSLAFCAALATLAPACSDDFLDEDYIRAYSTDYFKTQDGIDALVTGTYQKLKFKFNYIWAIECYNMGVDEFTDANNTMAAWNNYTSSLNPDETGANQPIWDNYYGTVEPANCIIAYTPSVYDKSSATYNTRLGEGYFFRAYAYFELVKQFGGVPIKLNPSNSVETSFTRNSAEECYAQIIADFEQAYELLPEQPEATGRITKSAAAHFLAKAHLFRASEINNDWNASYKSADLDAVIKYGEEVVEAHPLCADFVELWDFNKADDANESVSEVVLAAQFTDDWSNVGRFGNQMHLYFPSVYQDLGGTKRDISGGREFSYVSATEYTMQVFDRVNDSRFWKSFITAYGCNSTSTAPTWDSTAIADNLAPDGAAVGDKRFVGGEIAIKYIVNDPGDTRYSILGGKDNNGEKILKDGKLTPNRTFVRYLNGQELNWNTGGVDDNYSNYYNIYPHKRSVALSKFRDGYRNSIASQFGCRDAIIARSADDVLMIAEAYVRKGDYSSAFTWVNKLRDRAGFAAGEDRSKNVDGGQAYKNNAYCSGKGGGFSADGAIFSEFNTYYESNNLEGQEETLNALSTKEAMAVNSVEEVKALKGDATIFEKLGLSSDADIMLAFILNERTRELIGESHRWEDLARTKTLEARWWAFNDGQSHGGAFDASKHYYRPIPQAFIDGLTVSDEQKAAMQNPGY